MNLYEILGVGKDASGEEIKNSYRKKASQLHPDKGGNKEEFQKLQHAYEILSDRSRRNSYDTTGETKQKDKKHEVLVAVVTLMKQVIERTNNPENLNLIEVVRNHIHAAQQGSLQEEEKIKEHMRKYKKLRRKFNKKKEGENMFENLVESVIRDDTLALARIADNKTDLVLMLHLLDDYTFQQEMSKDNLSTYFTVYTTNTTT